MLAGHGDPEHRESGLRRKHTGQVRGATGPGDDTPQPAAGRLLYVPEGVAHGFQTLEPDTEVSYQLSHAYVPEAATGVRWDDPAFGIEWPLEVTSMSAGDRARPDFSPA